MSGGEADEEGVTFSAFESWWKERAGIQDPDIPVLPEYMVMRITEKAKNKSSWSGNRDTLHGAAADVISRSTSKAAEKSDARRNWDSLGARLRTLVDMRRQWGNLHEMYETHVESMYELQPLPKWVRDPDSSFSAAWDLTSVALLLYVAITVPLRAGFEIDVELWTFAFFFDAFVDIFFIIDLIINFRTAFYDKDGMREERPWRMASHYLRGWFTIDLVSCLPLGYIGYFMDDTGDGDSSNFRAIKAFRLIRLSKMLRLARIKRILTKYGNNVNLQSYINIGFTMFIIIFLAHMLACFYYMIGTSDETLITGEVAIGWVKQQDWCLQADAQTPCNDTSAMISDPEAQDLVVGTGSRYIGSMYYVLNPLENGGTTAERGFGIFAELMRDIILGLIASLMTAIQIAMSTQDADTAAKLKGLKQWLESKNMPKSFQAKTMEFFNDLWSRQPVDPVEIFRQMPPSMRLMVTQFLYRRFLGSIPIFRDMSNEVIAALCLTVTPLVALKGQEIMKEGSVGQEMYMIMTGEVEVLSGTQRLGFLSEGAFFGEVPVLDDSSLAEKRTRTVRSVTDSTELCFITRAQMDDLKAKYPELQARINRFMRTGTRTRATGKLTRKSLQQVKMTRQEMDDCVKTYHEIKEAASYVRSEKNWDEKQVIPFTMITAAVRMKRRAKEARERLAFRRRKGSPSKAASANVSFGGVQMQPTPPSSSPPASRRQTAAEPEPEPEPEPQQSGDSRSSLTELVIPSDSSPTGQASSEIPALGSGSGRSGLDWGEITKPGTPASNVSVGNINAVALNTQNRVSSAASDVGQIMTGQAELVATVQAQAAEIRTLHTKLDELVVSLGKK